VSTPRPLSKDEQEDIKLARQFQALTATEGWKAYMDILSKWSGEYMSKLLVPTTTRDEDLLQKGALMALDRCMGLPARTIAAASDILARAGRTSEDDC